MQAIQNGKAIFYMTASFQHTEQGFDHQDTMPKVTAPENLTSFTDYLKANQEHIPEPLRQKFLAEKPIDIRPVQQYNWLAPEPTDSIHQVWIKANGQLSDDLRMHTYLLAYTSDFHFQIATIDHAMWFHRPFRVDDWLLYCMDSPSASNGRGLVKGQIYDRHGRLVASTMQEGVIRQR